MTEILAIVGGLGTTGLAVAIVVLALKLVRAKDETIAAGDQRDKWQDEYRTLTGQLASAEAALDETNALVAKERDLRAVAESQRNDAVRAERAATVQMLKESDAVDANAVIAVLLARPIGVLPEAKAVPDLSDPANRLLKPGDV